MSITAVITPDPTMTAWPRDSGSIKFGTTPGGGASAGSVERSVPGGIAKDIARSISWKDVCEASVSRLRCKFLKILCSIDNDSQENMIE